MRKDKRSHIKIEQRFQKKIRRNRIIHAIAGLTLAIILYKYVYQDIKLSSFIQELSSISDGHSIVLLLTAVLLMPLNWLLESKKWQVSLLGIIDLPVGKAFLYVFQGISLGIITPGRIGEYGGRVVYLPQEAQAAGAVGVFRCSLAQNLMNVGIGIWGFIILSPSLTSISELNNSLVYVLGIAILMVISIAYIYVPWLVNKLSRFSRWIPSQLASQSNRVTLKANIRIILYSLLRYVVYCVQYILILLAFGIEITPIYYIAGVALIFAIQSLLPLTPLLQFTIRGSIAVFVFGAIAQQEASLVLSSYAMWLLNLLIPAIFGVSTFLFMRTRTD